MDILYTYNKDNFRLKNPKNEIEVVLGQSYWGVKIGMERSHIDIPNSTLLSMSSKLFGKLCGYIIQHKRMDGHSIKQKDKNVLKIRKKIENIENRVLRADSPEHFKEFNKSRTEYKEKRRGLGYFV